MSKSKQIRRAAMALMLTGAFVGTSGVAEAKPLKSITAGVSTAPAEIDPLYRNINPFYRNIGAFWGTVNPFYRNIGAFWGDVDPFYRNIGAFWGDLNPLYRDIGAFSGQILPDYRNIGAFWDETGGLWTSIDSNWATAGTYATNPAAFATLTSQLKDLTAKSETYWGASVTSQTGKSFADGFANPLFAKYGINLNDPRTLEKLPANERSHFFMDWYDGLMNFSGTDHADHWMKTVNWTPLLTQTQGSGKDTVIGLIDFHIAGDTDLQSKTIYNGGVSNFSNGHGAAVGSLIAAAHDGKGVMGIAPNAKIAAYNPFDATGTADWPDIKAGIAAVASRGASVINLSLGVPGSVLDAGWRGVFTDSSVKAYSKTATYVIAAGNDGITQTQNVEFKDAFSTGFIVVGSVDPTGAISEFSNRPGNACLTADGKCGSGGKLNESGPLRNHFIVAPGELILVSDDMGGTTRLSGTSFAAPLVSGAIALLHDRWPWLKQQPMVTAAIILNSAKDLGAPGIDPVYGVGLLDVEASQAPLRFDTLKYYVVDGSSTKEVSVKTAQQTVTGAPPTTVNLSNAYLTAFEDLGSGVKRDFLIPLSSRFVGTQVKGEYFQNYVYDRMVDWASTAPVPKLGFANAPRRALTGTPNYDWQVSMSARVANAFGVRADGVRPRLHSALQFTSPEGGLSFTVGNGDGAVNVGAQSGFALRSDHDPQAGGVNPLLGFADGGAHAGVQVGVSPDLKMSIGITEDTRDRHDDDRLARGLDRASLAGLRDYRARATSMQLDYRVDSRLGVSVAMTQLAESSSLLGLRSIEANDFGNGTATRSITLGTHYALNNGLSFSASATGTQSESRGDAALRIGAGGLVGSSFQVGIAKTGLLGHDDRLRLSVAQPLRIENGSVDFKSVAVVNRETGEIGIVSQKIGIAPQQRRFVAEAIYATPILAGAAELSAFGRSELTGYEDIAAEIPSYMLGARARFAF